jgi:intron-binding protein aquarius
MMAHCFFASRFLCDLFSEIEECHAFELLRTARDRGNYLLTTHAKIIAMTCTHAALIRQQLIDLSFQYDSLVMEESAQILEARFQKGFIHTKCLL